MSGTLGKDSISNLFLFVSIGYNRLQLVKPSDETDSNLVYIRLPLPKGILLFVWYLCDSLFVGKHVVSKKNFWMNFSYLVNRLPL